jgi:hypothetical protein
MPATITDPLAQQLVTFLLGGGALAIITAVARFIWKWRTGKIAAEKENNTTLENQRIAAIQEKKTAERDRDAADRKRRIALEEVSRLRRLLIENGISPGDELDFENTAIPTKRKQK